MQKTNFYQDNEDLIFHVQKRIDQEKLFRWQPKVITEGTGVQDAAEYAQTWMDMLDTMGAYAADVATRAEQVEKESIELKDGEVTLPPAIQQNVSSFVELGGSALGCHVRYEGLSAPMWFEAAVVELVSRACPSTVLNIGWYGAIAKVIEHFGSEELKQTFVPKIAAGEYSGSMSLTEPDAGSDLASIRTFAEKQDDGMWTLHGSKQFISNGCGEISLVLAKTQKGVNDLKSIGMFLVPRHLEGKQNFQITKIEEKPGLHGSATCALEFSGSKGYLIGKPNEGFSYMLQLMNEARIAVGFQAIGLMEAAYRLAKDYTSVRKSWGKTLDQHEIVAEKLADMKAETRALRSLTLQAAYYASLIDLGEAKLKEDDLEDDLRSEIQGELPRLKRKLREWTPLIKWYGGERSFVHARTSLQLHGGYGYTTEYKPEWLVRESMILSIYEGTSEIQALMCVKDTMKEIIRNPRDFVEIALGHKFRGLAGGDPLRRKVHRMQEALHSSLITILYKLVKSNVSHNLSQTKTNDVLKIIRTLSKDLVKFENLSPALLHAERICEMKALVAMARSLIWDARTDASRTDLAEYFVKRALPRVMLCKAEIEAEDASGSFVYGDQAEAAGPSEDSSQSRAS